VPKFKVSRSLCSRKACKQNRLNRQRRIVERHSATYRSMRNTYFTRKRDNARLSLKQDAASASLHNFCVPPLAGSHYLPFASAHLISLFSPITTSDFPTRLNESSLMNFVKISNTFSRTRCAAEIESPPRWKPPFSMRTLLSAKATIALHSPPAALRANARKRGQ